LDRKEVVQVGPEMKKVMVREVMVPIEEYATVDAEATIGQAVAALEKAQARLGQGDYKHRAVIVLDKEKKVVGKLSQLDFIRGLEPKYRQIMDSKYLTRHGLTKEFLRSMLADRKLWDRSLEEICRDGSEIKVKEVMYTPEDNEYVTAGASLDEAIHQFVMGRHQSLLVMDGSRIVGILRLTDVFKLVAEACRVHP
jgi:CBS domain-containing protein